MKNSTRTSSDFDLTIVNEIRREFFAGQQLPVGYIFLCGGAGHTSLRNRVKEHIKDNAVEVLYPEDLFMNLMNREKSSDLLTYENLLASNCDVICLICESMGAAAELGAFVQSDETQKKLIVCIDKCHTRDRSFIRTGPVKYHEKQKGTVIWYSKNEVDDLANMISKASTKQIHHSYVNAEGELMSLKEHVYFIMLMLWFYEEIPRERIFDILKAFRGNLEFSVFCALFNAAVNLLIRKHCINERCDNISQEYKSVLSLTRRGEAEARCMIEKWNGKSTRSKTLQQLFNEINGRKTRKNLPDKLRCDIMYSSLYSNPKP